MNDNVSSSAGDNTFISVLVVHSQTDDRFANRLADALRSIGYLVRLSACDLYVQQEPSTEASAHQMQYNIAAIRDLMKAAFTANEIWRFSQERPSIRPVHAEFGVNPSLGEMIDDLIVYCEKRDLLTQLLDEIREYNPGQYARHEERLRLDGMPSANGMARSQLESPSTSHGRSLRDIVKIINPHDVLIFIVSPETAVSEKVTAMASTAKERGKQVIAIVQGATEAPAALLDVKQVDFRGSWENALEKLHQSLPDVPIRTALRLWPSDRLAAFTGLLPPRLQPQPLPLIFVPRVRIIRHLLKCLERSRTTVMVGPPGFGKSTLATAAIDQLGWPYLYYRFEPNDDVLVFLETLLVQATQVVDGIDRGESVPLVARVERIRRPLRSSEDLAQVVKVIVEYFQHPSIDRLLLILDDYHLVTETKRQEVGELFSEAARCLASELPQSVRLLITSRECLASLKNIAAVHEMPIGGFSEDETAQFLGMAFPQEVISSELVGQVQRKLEGWPLGLTHLVQLTAPSASLEEALKSLHGKHPKFVNLFGELVISQLDADDRNFLVETSVARELNGDLCRRVTGRADAHAVLNRLAGQQSTFVFSFGGERFWFRCHDLFRDILRQELANDPRRERDALRKASHYYESESLWNQAIATAVEGQDFERALKMMLQHGESFYQRAQYETLLGWLDKLLEKHQEDAQVLAWLSFMKGRILERRGAREEAFECVRRSAEAHKETGDIKGWSKSVNKLGTIKLRQREYAEARKYFLQSYQIRFEIGDVIGQAQALYSLGDIYWHLGRLQNARQYLQESLQLNHNAGSTEGIAIVDVMLGKLEKAQGQFEAAHSLFCDALLLNRELDNRFGIQVAESFLAEIALLRGELDEAIAYGQSSLRAAQAMANDLGIAINSKLIGEALLIRGDLRAADEHLERARHRNERMHDRRGRAILLTVQALIPWCGGDLERTAQMLTEATRFARQTSDNMVLGSALISLAEVHALRTDYDGARACLAEAEEVLRRIAGIWYPSLLRRARGVLRRQQQDDDMGIPDLDWALSRFREMGARYELARTELEIAEAFTLANDQAEAQYHMESAHGLVAAHGFGYIGERWQIIRGQ